ncbi:MAG TPA: RNA polymerase sigma factor [Candidatus Limnocylindrales bacterium]
MPPHTGEPTTNEDLSPEAAEPGRSSDAELIIRMQADDLDAFETFFLRHRTLIYRTAYGLTGDRQAAEEVLQDTFARAYRHRATLLPELSPVPWLHRVALNLCYSRLDRRRLKAEPIVEATAALLRDGAVEPAERAERQELRAIVREGIAALPPKHQSVVVLYYLQGLSLQETASFLDVRLGTVKSRLHYALRSLRSHLERDRRFESGYGRLPSAADLERDSA